MSKDMPTYLYETLPDASVPARRFEMRQNFGEPPLAADPVTGAPVRRVISGGLGIVSKRSGGDEDAAGACGPESCTCGHFD
jgi:predicted nucleic acid-binding Zn ribbon protein